MKKLGQLEVSRFDTAITDEDYAGGTALIAESESQDSQVTLIIPSMNVSQIVTYLLASAQDSRGDMNPCDVDEKYRTATPPTATPEILRIKIDYEKKQLILDAGSGLLYFRLSDAVLDGKDLLVWDTASTNPVPTILKSKDSSFL